MTGTHANTVREHLEGLRGAGLVRRSAAPASGRGRPGWLYEATELSHDDPRPEYAGLAIALASVVSRSSPAPAEAARVAGVQWGRELARGALADSAAAAALPKAETETFKATRELGYRRWSQFLTVSRAGGVTYLDEGNGESSLR